MTKLDHEKEKTWNDCLESVRVSVSSAIFSTWFSQTHLISIREVDNKRLVAEIGCPSSFVKTTIETRYYGLIKSALEETTGKKCELVFVIKDIPKKTVSLGGPLFESPKEGRKEFLSKLVLSGVRSNMTFANFAVSSSNQMAWAAAEAVAKNPGKAYNPLFLWGGVGVGKTHLMNAIGYRMIKDSLKKDVHFCTGEQFTNDIVEGIRNKTTQEFRRKYRRLRLLAIDDIQFIAGKNSVQEEFFHTFNSLTLGGGQVVLTSDNPPSEIAKLEERLRSRFEAGLIVDIAPPDFELRCAIIQIKAKEKGVDLDDDLIRLIAGNIDSARRIEGLLVSLSSIVKIQGETLDEDRVKSLLGRRLGEENGDKIKATPQEVIEAACKYFSIKKKGILGKGRARPLSRPRQILMYVLRTELGLPLQEVGRLIGGRDHTTVIHAVDKVTVLAKENVETRQDIRGIKKLL